jgi:hypothetical protein
MPDFSSGTRKQKTAEIPTQSERAIRAVLADSGSADQRAHRFGDLKRDCPICHELTNHRCRDQHRCYVPTHPERLS